jgi:hypothetical protein
MAIWPAPLSSLEFVFSVTANALLRPPPREALLPAPDGASRFVHPSHPASVGLACRPVGAWRRQLMKQLDSTRAARARAHLHRRWTLRPFSRTRAARHPERHAVSRRQAGPDMSAAPAGPPPPTNSTSWLPRPPISIRPLPTRTVVDRSILPPTRPAARQGKTKAAVKRKDKPIQIWL